MWTEEAPANNRGLESWILELRWWERTPEATRVSEYVIKSRWFGADC